MIKWKATSVNGLVEYEQEAESFKELFDELDEMGKRIDALVYELIQKQ